MVEATFKATAEWIRAQLTAGVTPSADLASAIAAIEAAGWPPTHVIGPASALLGENLQQLHLARLSIVAAATGGIVVVSQPGTWVGYSDAVITATEPSISGMAVTAYAWAVADAGAGAVATMTGGP